jgi:hypothetical protein
MARKETERRAAIKKTFLWGEYTPAAQPWRGTNRKANGQKYVGNPSQASGKHRRAPTIVDGIGQWQYRSPAVDWELCVNPPVYLF